MSRQFYRNRPALPIGAALTVAGLVLGLVGPSWGFWVAGIGLLLANFYSTDVVAAYYSSGALGANSVLRKVPTDQLTEQLEATADVIGWLRPLAFKRPAHAYRLGESLDRQRLLLKKLGRHDAQLVVAEEAVAVWKVAGHSEGLADALVGLSVAQGQAGWSGDDQLPALQAAVRLHHQELAERQPKAARALANLVITLHQLDRYADALAPAEETVALLRSASRQDSAQRKDLALAHHRLSRTLVALDRPRAAAAEAEHEVAVWRALDDADELAVALRWAGQLFQQTGRFHEGADLLAEADRVSGRTASG